MQLLSHALSSEFVLIEPSDVPNAKNKISISLHAMTLLLGADKIRKGEWHKHYSFAFAWAVENNLDSVIFIRERRKDLPDQLLDRVLDKLLIPMTAFIESDEYPPDPDINPSTDNQITTMGIVLILMEEWTQRKNDIPENRKSMTEKLIGLFDPKSELSKLTSIAENLEAAGHLSSVKMFEPILERPPF